MLSPFCSSKEVAPSKLTQAGALPSSDFLNSISMFSGKIKGLNEREWGASGVKAIAGTFDCMIDPPAAKL